MEGSGSLSRSLIGRNPNFRTTRKALAGSLQVQAGIDQLGVQPQNLSSRSPSTPRGGRAGAASMPTVVPMPSSSGTRFGHTEPTNQWDRFTQGASDYYANDPTTQWLGGIWETLTREPAPSEDPPHWMMTAADRVQNGFPAYEPVGERGEGMDFARGGPGAVRRAMETVNGGQVEGASRDQIMGAVQTAYMEFEANANKWRTLRDGALRDGEAETAAQYDRQIRNEQQAIDDLKREIQVAGDVESWYRKIVEAPFIAAREAAANVNYQPTLDLKDESVARIDEEYFGVNQRLDKVLADIGFTPEQQQALKLGAAEDNAVAAAQMQVLDATSMRPGILEHKKALMFHTADQLRIAELRKSTGNELVEVEPRKRNIAKRAEEIGFLTKEKADAVARTRRAVERQYGDGPMMPTRDEIVDTALNTMMESLGADLPPGQRQAYLDGAWALINSGLTEISNDSLYNAFQSGALRADAVTAAALDDLYNRSEDMTDAEYDMAKRKIIEDMFDEDDRVIFQSLLDTYQTAWAESEQILADRASYQGSNAGGENRVAANIQAARNQDPDSVYGIRRTSVLGYADFFRDMGIRVDSGFRTGEPGPGQIANSDHYTGGALDLFFDYNNKEDMAYYNSRVRPILENLMKQGVVAQILHPGHNSAHMDHAHVSFGLGANDGYYSTADSFKDPLPPTGTAGTDTGMIGGR